MPAWTVYDWEVRKEPAEFTVDASFDMPQEGYRHLLYCAVSAMNDAAFTNGDIRRIAKLEKQLVKALPDAIYVGHILMNALHQFYFYVQDPQEALLAAEAVADKTRKLGVSPGTAEEADWTTYFRLLYPDAAKEQTIQNAELIAQQVSVGDALDKPRRLTLFLCFSSDSALLLFQPAAKAAGFALGDTEYYPELSTPYIQPLYIITALDKRAVDQITTRAIYAAQPFEGVFLRWTAPRMAKKSPLA